MDEQDPAKAPRPRRSSRRMRSESNLNKHSTWSHRADAAEVHDHHVDLDTLDPQGYRGLSSRLSDEIHHTEEEERAKDPEQGKRLTHDPFDKEGHFDLGKFLEQKTADAIENGRIHQSMGIAFRDLKVSGNGTGSKVGMTFGSLLTSPLRIRQFVHELRNPPVKPILKGIDGCAKPGEMVLVLGRPGAGCTTLLKSLASYRDGYRSIDGTVLYEGLDHTAIDGPLRGEVVYAPEDDIHFATLSVADTLAFATAARTPSSGFRDFFNKQHSRSEYISLMRETFATILGLRHTYNTKVGGDLVRGVSGGERKRVTIAETLASHARVALFDNSSRGLDASTALEFVTALRISTDIAKTTTFASVYQAGESLAQQFDKVVVLNEGHMVYYGPLEKATSYFKSIGYLPYERQTTPDFLVACTDVHGRRLNPKFRGHIPRTAEEQAATFRQSEVGRANIAEVDAYLEEMKHHMDEEAQKNYIEETRAKRARRVRQQSPFLLSWPMQVRLAIKRRAQITMGDWMTVLIVSLASTIQAILLGSLFYQIKATQEGIFPRTSIMFFALMYNSFLAMSEITVSYMQRPIVIRQSRYAMLRPSADALAVALLDIPIRLVTLTFFVIPLYFMAGLSYDAGKFFVFWCCVLLVTYALVACFRMIASLTRSEAMATMIAGIFVIDLVLYAGYAIPRLSMVVWWRWLSYCNPVSFIFELMLTNELRGLKIDCTRSMVPAGPEYNGIPYAYKVCPVMGAQPGQPIISGEAYGYANYGYRWDQAGRNAGIVIAMWIVFVLITMLGAEFQTDPSASSGVMVFRRNKKALAEMDAKRAEAEARASRAAGQDAPPEETQEWEVHSEKPGAAGGALQVSDEVFSWHNVCYDIPLKGETRRLLDNVSGFVAPGKMTALMGESGAGKTTLLNVLAQRTDMGVVTGDFFVNGRPLPRSFQADTGYCQQQDIHLAQHTVREALQFSALLRQPRETPRQERLDYVETVIKLLEMESFAEAIIGDVGEGLNVEQRKRLTIGVELAAKPRLLLYLDEPTSGLDAQASWSIVRFLKKLAAEGQAILCTIHQPSGELFNQFDRLLLLQKGGRTVYFGDLGENSSELIRYFEERSGVECDKDANPAEYMLDMIGAGATATTDKDWPALFRASPEAAKMNKQLAQFEARRNEQQDLSEETVSRNKREYAQPVGVQIAVTTGRLFQAYWRNPDYIMAKLGLNLLSGLFIGSSFWGQGQNQTKIALQNRMFAIFLALCVSTPIAQQLQPVFIQIRDIYEARERPSKMYRWPVFVLSAAVVEIPWSFFCGTILWIPWYFMVHFDHDGKRAAYSWGMYMLFQLYYVSFAQTVAILSANALLASMLYSTLFSFVVVYCGVMQPPGQMPHFWSSWMFYLSPFTWFVEGMFGDAVKGKPVRCAPMEMNRIYPPSGQSCDSYLGNFTSSLNQPAKPGTGYYETAPDGSCLYCTYREAEDYINNIWMHSKNEYRDIGLVIVYIIFNFFLMFGIYAIVRTNFLSSLMNSQRAAKPLTPAAAPAEGGSSSGTAVTDDPEKQVSPATSSPKKGEKSIVDENKVPSTDETKRATYANLDEEPPHSEDSPPKEDKTYAEARRSAPRRPRHPRHSRHSKRRSRSHAARRPPPRDPYVDAVSDP